MRFLPRNAENAVRCHDQQQKTKRTGSDGRLTIFKRNVKPAPTGRDLIEPQAASRAGLLCCQHTFECTTGPGQPHRQS